LPKKVLLSLVAAKTSNHANSSIIRCSSCYSVSEEHLMGPSMSVCLFLLWANQPAWSEIIVAQQWPWNISVQERPQITLVQQWPTWCGMKNTTEISVYFKQYTFPILFFLW
jgi:hypothetical protein